MSYFSFNKGTLEIFCLFNFQIADLIFVDILLIKKKGAHALQLFADLICCKQFVKLPITYVYLFPSAPFVSDKYPNRRRSDAMKTKLIQKKISTIKYLRILLQKV